MMVVGTIESFIVALGLCLIGGFGGVSAVGEELEYTHVLEGEVTLLRCHFSQMRSHRVIWYHVETMSLLTIGRHHQRSLDLDRQRRYSVKNDGGGVKTFDLEIRDSRARDNGTYVCAFDREGVIIKIVERALIVHPLPEEHSPTCHAVYVMSEPVQSEDRYVDLICSWNSTDGSIFDVTWYRDDVTVTSTAVSPTVPEIHHKRVLETLEAMDEDAVFQCVMRSPYSTVWSRSCSVVPFSSSGLQVRLDPPEMRVRNGSNVTLQCIAPTAKKVSWSLDPHAASRFLKTDRFEVSDEGRILTLSGLTLEDDNTKVTCVNEMDDGSLASTYEVIHVFAASDVDAHTDKSSYPTALHRLIEAKSLCIFLAISLIAILIIFAICGILLYEKYDHLNSMEKNGGVAVTKQRSLIRRNVVVDSVDAIYHTIPYESRDGSENANKEWNMEISGRVSGCYESNYADPDSVGYGSLEENNYMRPTSSTSSTPTNSATGGEGSTEQVEVEEPNRDSGSVDSKLLNPQTTSSESSRESDYMMPTSNGPRILKHRSTSSGTDEIKSNGNVTGDAKTGVKPPEDRLRKKKRLGKFPLYAKPNKVNQSSAETDLSPRKQTTLSVDNDSVINFYENVSKHNSLTSRLSRENPHNTPDSSSKDTLNDRPSSEGTARPTKSADDPPSNPEASNKSDERAPPEVSEDIHAKRDERQRSAMRESSIAPRPARPDTGYASADGGERNSWEEREMDADLEAIYETIDKVKTGNEHGSVTIRVNDVKMI